MTHIRTLAALAVSALALAACDQKPAQAPAVAAPAVIAQVVSGATGTDQAVACMAYLALQQGAIEARTPPGDITAVRAAMNDWEGLALKTMTPDEVGQYFASSIAAEDDSSPAVVEVTSAWCLANKPAA
jgi:hypothetical protein